MIEQLGVPAINLVASPLSASSMLKKEIFDRLLRSHRASSACADAGCYRPRGKAVLSRGPVVFQAEAQGR